MKQLFCEYVITLSHNKQQNCRKFKQFTSLKEISYSQISRETRVKSSLKKMYLNLCKGKCRHNSINCAYSFGVLAEPRSSLQLISINIAALLQIRKVNRDSSMTKRRLCHGNLKKLGYNKISRYPLTRVIFKYQKI